MENKTKDVKSLFLNELNEAKKLLKEISKIKATPGKDGKDYILTDLDKDEIASLIEVPIVEKIIEKTETIKEIPQEIIGEEIVNKINDLPTDDSDLKIDAKHIKNLPEVKQFIGGGGGKSNLSQLNDVNLGTLSNDDVLKYNSTTGLWENGVGGGGGTWGSITGTLSDQTDLQIALNAKQAILVSGTNIKTINGSSILGSGDLAVSGGATTALDNLASVSINTALVLGTSDAFALGSTTKQWSDLFLAEGGVINWDNGDVTITQTGNSLTVAGGDFFSPTLYGTTANLGNGVLGLTIKSTTAASAANKGQIRIGTYAVFDEYWEYVGIGTQSPTSKIHLKAGGGLNSGLLTESTNASLYATTDWKNNAGDVAQMLLAGSTFTNGIFTSRSASFYTSSDALILGTGSASGYIKFFAGGYNTTDERMRMTTTALSPLTDDGLQLGSTTNRWSDLFLAEGGVINWDNGDVTITQTGNTLAFAGATTAYTFDSPIRLKGYTVAGLPTGTIGDTAYVTDALAPTFGATVVGGGAVTIKVFYDGTNWIVG